MLYLGVVVKCFQYERSSRQSLQFLRPTHQKFQFHIYFRSFWPDFLSVFHGEDTVSPQELRIDCKFQCQAAAKRALCSIQSANCTTFAVWMPKKM